MNESHTKKSFARRAQARLDSVFKTERDGSRTTIGARVQRSFFAKKRREIRYRAFLFPTIDSNRFRKLDTRERGRRKQKNAERSA